MTATNGPTNATRPDGTRYYRGGCVTGMPLEGACHRRCLHRATVLDYRDARAAWEDARDSGRTAPAGVAGAAGSLVSMSQLEDVEYAEHHTPPIFRAWLEGHRGANQDPGQ